MTAGERVNVKVGVAQREDGQYVTVALVDGEMQLGEYPYATEAEAVSAAHALMAFARQACNLLGLANIDGTKLN